MTKPLCVVILSLQLVAQCPISPPPPPPPPLPPQDMWLLDNYPQPVTQGPGDGGSFDFVFSPLWDGYFVHSYSSALPSGGTITFQVEVDTTGTPVFDWHSEPGNTCEGIPAAAHPFFSSENYVIGSNEFGRWWASSSDYFYVLAAGSATLTVPLTPDKWISVFGKAGNLDSTTLAGFNAALANVKYIGLTMGGGCFLGHGVNVSGGTATFKVVSYSVTP